MSLVSVVIPTYNRLPLLKIAIASAINQSYKDIEIVVVDDGSTDGTPDYVAATFGNLVKLVSKTNGGVSSARNVGIRLSSGNLIAFLDSDDQWLPDKLAKQCLFLERNPEFGMVLCDCVFIDEQRRQTLVCRRRQKLPRDGFILDDVFRSPSLIPSSVLVRKCVLEDVGYFDESIKTAEDLDLHLRIASKYKIGLIDEPLCNCMGNHAGLSMEAGTYDDHVFVMERFVRQLEGGERLPYREALFGTYIEAANGKFWMNEWRAGVHYGLKSARLAKTFPEALALAHVWGKGLKYLAKRLRDGKSSIARLHL
jgi:glycosyltransferase involved in cell wall biosynthesis